jgi:hypothetical protein
MGRDRRQARALRKSGVSIHDRGAVAMASSDGHRSRADTS